MARELDRVKAELLKTREDMAAQLSVVSSENEVRVLPGCPLAVDERLSTRV